MVQIVESVWRFFINFIFHIVSKINSSDEMVHLEDEIYRTISTFTSVHTYSVDGVPLASRPVTLPIPAIISQNVTTKSCYLCVKREKYGGSISLVKP